jgi:hypothetical protein
MKKKITLSWNTEGNTTEYFLNERSTGFDETGFRNILKYISLDGNINRLLVKYPAAGNTGGEPQQGFPFYIFFEEFLKSTAQENITVEYEPVFYVKQ